MGLFLTLSQSADLFMLSEEGGKDTARIVNYDPSGADSSAHPVKVSPNIVLWVSWGGSHPQFALAGLNHSTKSRFIFAASLYEVKITPCNYKPIRACKQKSHGLTSS